MRQARRTSTRKSVNDLWVIENREFFSGRQQLDWITSHVFDNRRAVLENCKAYAWAKDIELIELPNNNQYLLIIKCEDKFVALPELTGHKPIVILTTLQATYYDEIQKTHGVKKETVVGKTAEILDPRVSPGWLTSGSVDPRICV